MLTYSLRGAGVALVMAVSGCSGVTIAPVHSGTSTAGNDFDFVGGGRDFTTVVIGNPYGGDSAAFDERVTAALNETNVRQRTNFTTKPGPSARRSYKLVLVFNSGRLSENSLCQDTAALRGGPAGTSPMTVQAGFCNGGASAVDVYASMGDGSPPGALQDMLGQVQLALFPSQVHTPFRPGT
jgi:hypothetical protein